MTSPTTDSLVSYYQNLLLTQYNGMPKASAHIGALTQAALMPQTQQTITFSSAPSAGTVVINWNGAASAAVNWNDTAAQIQTKLRAVAGLSAVVVTGSVAGLALTVARAPQAPLFTFSSNSLGVTVTAASLTLDPPLPLAVAAAFDVTSATPASGAQLDTLGKYVGVKRTGTYNGQSITLDDAHFLTLIQMATARNAAGSDLSSVQSFLQTWLPSVRVFDYQNMGMSYLASFVSTVFSAPPTGVYSGNPSTLFGPGPMGRTHDEIRFRAQSAGTLSLITQTWSATTGNAATQYYIEIYSDNAGSRGTLLATSDAATTPTVGNPVTISYTFNAQPITLTAGTVYWWRFTSNAAMFTGDPNTPYVSSTPGPGLLAAGEEDEFGSTSSFDQTPSTTVSWATSIYAVDSGLQSLIQLAIAQGLLPKPAAVSLSLVSAPTPATAFFGCRTYAQNAGPNTAPANTYASYVKSGRTAVTYSNAIIVPPQR